MPKVSIIIPVYNSEKYINDLTDSLRNQTLKDIEIIFIDDGSVDNSKEIIKKYQNQDERIKYFYQQNQGGGAARNLGIENASGDYLLFLDSDDIFETDVAEQLYNRAVETNSDIVISLYKVLDTPTGKIFNNKGINKKIITDKNSVISFSDINFNFQISNPSLWNKLYKRDFIVSHNIKCSSSKIINDVKFYMMSLMFSKRIAFSDKELLTYRAQNNNSVSKNRGIKLINSLPVYKEIYYEFKQRNLFNQVKEQYTKMIIDTIKHEIGFPVDEDTITELNKILSEEPFYRLSKSELKDLFGTKKIIKNYILYKAINLITLNLNKSLQAKLSTYINQYENVKKLITAHPDKIYGGGVISYIPYLILYY